ncbi:endonuclease/exonuclease/phosphatase family protein [Mechercharimyces sp. CAU 1602]|uniref:endonuclease/exonuclease/phosphatase family protein n=1 Tax=Mechercharimyces sp. CAU 1602 TaxID=2973933 RepID=UPI0021631655|nr:endonuclease/exonuclease/phosphatase family protein [Mechercharimyces sp. CAU 1602]MCS1351847.1 hypothetical protein [Mechercharimyces sp. CAU 1602]
MNKNWMISIILTISLCFISLGSVVGAEGETSSSLEDEGSFTLLNYNVAGLWAPLSGSNPDKNTKKISALLNNYDIVTVQENFNYHDELVSKVDHPYISKHDSVLGFGTGTGDGLTRLSMFKFKDFKRKEWKNCHGYFDQGSDCLTPKGFTFARHEVSEGVFVDVYNVHADAGRNKDDLKAKEKNFKQVLEKVEKWSEGNAVIIAGDFNSTYNYKKYKDGLRRFPDAGFTDVWAEFDNNGVIPGIDEKEVDGDRIEKIFYRSGKEVKLSIDDYQYVTDVFVDEKGKDLSDHRPIYSKFSYRVVR